MVDDQQQQQRDSDRPSWPPTPPAPPEDHSSDKETEVDNSDYGTYLHLDTSSASGGDGGGDAEGAVTHFESVIIARELRASAVPPPVDGNTGDGVTTGLTSGAPARSSSSSSNRNQRKRGRSRSSSRNTARDQSRRKRRRRKKPTSIKGKHPATESTTSSRAASLANTAQARALVNELIDERLGLSPPISPVAPVDGSTTVTTGVVPRQRPAPTPSPPRQQRGPAHMRSRLTFTSPPPPPDDSHDSSSSSTPAPPAGGGSGGRRRPPPELVIPTFDQPDALSLQRKAASTASQARLNSIGLKSVVLSGQSYSLAYSVIMAVNELVAHPTYVDREAILTRSIKRDDKRDTAAQRAGVSSESMATIWIEARRLFYDVLALVHEQVEVPSEHKDSNTIMAYYNFVFPSLGLSPDQHAFRQVLLYEAPHIYVPAVFFEIDEPCVSVLFLFVLLKSKLEQVTWQVVVGHVDNELRKLHHPVDKGLYWFLERVERVRREVEFLLKVPSNVSLTGVMATQASIKMLTSSDYYNAITQRVNAEVRARWCADTHTYCPPTSVREYNRLLSEHRLTGDYVPTRPAPTPRSSQVPTAAANALTRTTASGTPATPAAPAGTRFYGPVVRDGCKWCGDKAHRYQQCTLKSPVCFGCFRPIPVIRKPGPKQHNGWHDCPVVLGKRNTAEANSAANKGQFNFNKSVDVYAMFHEHAVVLVDACAMSPDDVAGPSAQGKPVGYTYYVTFCVGDGPELRALVDSGAQLSFVQPSVVSGVETASVPAFAGALANGSVSSPITEAAHVTLCFRSTDDTDVNILQRCYVLQGLTVPLLLGGDFLERHSATIDYNAHTLTLCTLDHNSTPTHSLPLLPFQSKEASIASVTTVTVGDYVLTFGDMATDADREFVLSYVCEDGSCPLFAGSAPVCTVSSSTFQVTIDKKANSKPWPFVTSLRYPVHLKDTVQALFDVMVEQGILEETTELACICPSFAIAKSSSTPDNRKYRLVTDFGIITDILDRGRYSLPNVADMLAEISNAISQMESPVMVVLDAASGFYALEIHPDSRKFLGTIGPDGRHYRYAKLAQGLSIAPEAYTAFLTAITPRNLHRRNVWTFIDDSFVVADGNAAMRSVLTELFNAYIQNGVQISNVKSVFMSSQVEWLAHKFTKAGTTPADAKIEAVKNLPHPTTRAELRCTYGFVQYFSRYIPAYSRIAHPIRKLLKQTEQFEWSAEAADALEQLKHIVCTQVVRHLNFNLEFIMEVDASSFGLGVVLLQRGIDPAGDSDTLTEYPVAFASRATTDPETRYAACDLEILVITFGVRKFSNLLLGKHFLIRSDNTTVVHLLKKRNNAILHSARMERYRISLAHYDFTIEHRRGTNNGAADALSRFPVGVPSTEVPSEAAADYAFLNENLGIPLSDLEGDDFTAPPVVLFAVAVGGEDVEAVPAEQTPEPAQYVDRPIDDRFPPDMSELEIMNVIHQECSHSGEHRTVFLAKSKYGWYKGVYPLARAVIKACKVCQMIAKRKAPAGSCGSLKANWPGELVCVDLFKKNLFAGKVHCLSIVDVFTGYAFVVRIEHETTKDVLKGFALYCSTVGVPLAVVCDNGSQLASGAFQKYMASANVDVHYAVAYSPESNSPVERAHRDLKRIFMAMVAAAEELEEGTEADAVIHHTLCQGLITLNTSVKMEHGRSAYELFFGRVPITHEPQLGMTPASMYEDVRRQRAARAADRDAEFSDDPDEPTYAVGDLVMLENLWRRSACAPYRLGPFAVTAVQRGSPFAMIAGGDGNVKLVRASKLTRYEGDQPLAIHIPTSKPPALAEPEQPESGVPVTDSDFLDHDLLLDMVDDFVDVYVDVEIESDDE